MGGSADLHHPDIMNAIPVPIFLVDDDVRILDLNLAASTSFGLSKEAIYSRRGGDALHCLHSYEVPEGCGRAPACKKCVIRNAVGSSVKGTSTTRRRMKFEIRTEGKITELELLISASPFPQAGQNVVLLVIEDFTELSRLRAIIPICSQCKRVRNEAEFWQQVEAYFHDYIGVDFSHGLCPDCLKQFYGQYINTDTSAE
ncbi:MAG: PAS domain-containing protein [Terriglobales bacterium]